MGSSYSPQQVMGSELGSAVQRTGQSIGSKLDANARDRHILEMEMLKSQITKNQAEAGYYDSQKARAVQEANAQPGISTTTRPDLAGQQFSTPNLDLLTIKPSQYTSSTPGKPWLTPGLKPGYSQSILPGGLPMLHPDPGNETLEELFENMNYPARFGLLLYNAKEFGYPWLEEYFKLRFFGVTPKGSYSSGGPNSRRSTEGGGSLGLSLERTRPTVQP